MTNPYLSPSPREVSETITIRQPEGGLWNYQIDLGRAGYLHIDAPDLNALFVTIAERLFDDASIDMAAADRVAYLMHCVLADRDMPIVPKVDYSHLADGWAVDEEVQP